MEKLEAFMQFSKNNLNQINIEVIPPQKKYPEEKFLFNYEKNKEIKMFLNANKKEVFYDVNIELDRLNKIKTAKII
jgi:hypothetical protein